MPLALSANHDDDDVCLDGHAANCARLRRRRRSAPATGPGSRRRLNRLATADSLHHSGDLPLPGVVPGLGSQTPAAALCRAGCRAYARVSGVIFLSFVSCQQRCEARLLEVPIAGERFLDIFILHTDVRLLREVDAKPERSWSPSAVESSRRSG